MTELTQLVNVGITLRLFYIKSMARVSKLKLRHLAYKILILKRAFSQDLVCKSYQNYF